MSGPLRLVLATANPDKASEVVAILTHALGDRVEILPRPSDVPDVEETGDSLEENARLKAQAIVAATGEAAVADDTGLEVNALGGAPGIYSARYAGEEATYRDNVAKLLFELEGNKDRVARFCTVALALFPDGSELVTSGIVYGVITEEPRGEHGFGYDPVFLPDFGHGQTFAEMSAFQKQFVSHRGLAFTTLAARLKVRP